MPFPDIPRPAMGSVFDDEAAPGASGSMSAKLRLMTDELNQIAATLAGSIFTTGTVTVVTLSGAFQANQGAAGSAAWPVNVKGLPLPVGVSGTVSVTGPLVQGAVQVAGSYLYANLAASGTTTITSGAGILHAVVVNTPGTGSVLTLYDNTGASGNKIATIDTTRVNDTRLYDAAFGTGLTAVATGGATPADVTLTYL